MKFLKGAVLTWLIMTSATLPAHAAFQAIYEVLGVYDNGPPAQTGVATAFHCTNTTNNPVNVRVFVRGSNGAIAGSTVTASIVAQGTFTFTTKQTTLFFASVGGALNTGSVTQGRARIFTEVPTAIICAADMLDAANFPPVFVATRRMIRLPRGTSGGED